MKNDPVARLAEHYQTGIGLLNNELKAAHDEATEAAAIQRERAWTAVLEEIAKPFGSAFVGRLVPNVGAIEQHELRIVEDAPPPRSFDHAMALVTLATRLHRINAKLDQLEGTAPMHSPARPRGRPKSDKPLAKRGEDWAAEMQRERRRQPKPTYREVAEKIALREQKQGRVYATETIEREAREVRRKRGTAGQRKSIPRR